MSSLQPSAWSQLPLAAMSLVFFVGTSGADSNERPNDRPDDHSNDQRDDQPTDQPNGFDLSNASVPRAEIYEGGPPRDGIAALESPALLSADAAPWRETDFVIGVELDGEARAYPIAILEWHELVNDTLGGTPILVSWCPLCGTALVFDRRLDERVLDFGVSGLLYQSDLLMFDRATLSLWSQIAARAVTGDLRDRRLRILRSKMTTWRHWKRLHPTTKVLSERTGYERPYLESSSPYGNYPTSPELRFPAAFAERFHAKEPTLGVRASDGSARAYTRTEIQEAGGCIRESFAGQTLLVEWIHPERTFEVRFDARLPARAPRAAPEPSAPTRSTTARTREAAAHTQSSKPGIEPAVELGIEVVEGYWFAWSAFHPNTSVFEVAGSTACTTKDDDPKLLP